MCMSQRGASKRRVLRHFDMHPHRRVLRHFDMHPHTRHDIRMCMSQTKCGSVVTVV